MIALDIVEKIGRHTHTHNRTHGLQQWLDFRIVEPRSWSRFEWIPWHTRLFFFVFFKLAPQATAGGPGPMRASLFNIVLPFLGTHTHTHTHTHKDPRLTQPG